MNKLKSTHIKTLIFCILLFCFFVFGILGIIFGATKGITFLLVVGIVGVVLGFYGTPIAFVKYVEQKTNIAVLDCIINDNLLNINSIASSIGQKPKAVLSTINFLITNRYLKGYLIEGEVLKPIQNQETVITHKCPYCGATLALDKEISACEYCGARLKINTKK